MRLAFVEVDLPRTAAAAADRRRRSLRCMWCISYAARATMLGTWGARLRNQAEKMDLLRLLSSFALMHREAVAADADATLLNSSTTLTL
jgi:hypothetical protein